MNKRTCLVFCFAVFMAISAYAGWVEQSMGLSVWVPDDWKQEEGDGTLTVSSPDGVVSVVYGIVDAKDLKAAVKEIDKQLSAIMKKVKVVTKPHEVTVNNLTGTLEDGTGVIDDVAMDWSVSVYVYKNKALMVMGFAAKGLYDQHADNLKKMLTSIKSAWQKHSAGVEVWIPLDWKQEASKDLITVTSPDDLVSVVYISLPAKDLDAAAKSLDKELDTIMTDIVITTKPSNVNLNGLAAVVTDGTGKIGDVAVDWMVSLVTNKNKVLMIVGFAGQGLYEQHEANIEKMLKSVRPY
jgi:hypothetical protein